MVDALLLAIIFLHTTRDRSLFTARPFQSPIPTVNSTHLKDESLTTVKMVKDNPKTQPQRKTQPKKGRSAISDVVAREYTIHLHKRVCLISSAP